MKWRGHGRDISTRTYPLIILKMSASAASATDYKATIIDSLETLRKKEVASKETFKARAYKKAIDGLKTVESIRSYEDVEGVAGIGEKIREKIMEILSTGELASAKRAAASHAVHEELMAVYGIGPAKAAELVAAGIGSVADLRVAVAADGALLNDKQKIGLKHYEDLLQRIPHSEMLEHQAMLAELLPEEVERGQSKIGPLSAAGSPAADATTSFEIVGSFRRGAETSGDIDVLIRVASGQNGKKLLRDYITMMTGFGYLIETLALGDKKFMGICQLPGQPARRLDILMTPEAEYPYAVLYFTGSDTFNIAVRQWALERGYTLNEHKLTPIREGVKPVPAMAGERDILRFLRISYVAPELRTGVAVLRPLAKIRFVAEEDD